MTTIFTIPATQVDERRCDTYSQVVINGVGVGIANCMDGSTRVNAHCYECASAKKLSLRLSYLVYILVFALFFMAYNAHAADIGCGRDTDRNGSVDNLCPGDDKDFDGYTVAQGDCDDEDWDIWPGTPSTKGLSAGHYRVCKADGSGWTADTTSSVTPYCPSGDYTTTAGKSALACKYIDTVNGNDSTGDGSWSTPWKTPNKISYNNGSKYTAQAGDAFIILPGTYTETARKNADNDVVMFFAAKGTSTNPIWIVAYPGTRPVFTGEIDIYDADYNIYRGIEITDGTVASRGFTARSDTDYLDIASFYIHQKTGNREDNQSCIATSQGGTSNYVHHNWVGDCNDPLDAYQPNGSGIYMGQQTDDDRVEYNSIINDTGRSEICIYEKHTVYGSTGIIHGNYCKALFTSGNMSATGFESSGAPNRTVTNNLFIVTDVGIRLRDSGGPTYWGEGVFENNTIVAATATLTEVHWRWNTDATSTASDRCDGDAPFGDPYVFRYNINYSTSSTYIAHQHGAADPDVTYTMWHTGGMWQSSYNGLFSSGSSTAKMGMMFYNNSCSDYCCEQGSLGGEYVGLSAIQAAGYESNSIQADPQLASGTYIPANENMSTWGYMEPRTVTTTTTTTTSTTTTTTIPSSSGFSSRVKYY